MRKYVWIGAVAALGLAAAARGEDAAATEKVAQSLAQVASQVRSMLAQDKIHSQFDLFRKLKEGGVTYQPALVAPNDLAGRLDDEGLRAYAGIKLFDAIYAATFLQRRELNDCVKVIEDIQDKLDLRSHADLDNGFFETLKKAAAEPEAVDVQKLLAQLSADYVKNVPALMSSVEGAEYLIEGLYGFTIESAYVESHFFGNLPAEKLHVVSDTAASVEWMGILLQLFETFDRMGEEIRVSGETAERLAVIREMDAVLRGEMGKEMSLEAIDKAWRDVDAKVSAIRAGILTPGAD